MTVSDTYSSPEIENLVERIQEDEDDELIEADRAALLELDQKIRRQKMAGDRLGDHHHRNQLRMALDIALETQQLAATVDEETGREAVDDVLAWATDEDSSGSAIQQRLSTLRMFAAYLLDLDLSHPGKDNLDEQLPQRFAEISPSEHVEYDPAPNAANVITYDEVIRMVKKCDHVRNKAMLLVMWGAGLRPMSEFWHLQRKHIKDNGDHIKITVPSETKTGRREVILVVGAPMLRKWLFEEHPAHLPGEDDMDMDTFLWTHHNSNKHLCYNSIYTVFNNAGERLEDFDKDHDAQHFRRSSASVMASRPEIGERDLRKRFGWDRYSDAPEHYIKAMGEDTEVSVSQAYGHEIEKLDEPEPVAPIICAHCDKWTVRKLDNCIWCSHEIDEDHREVEHIVTNPVSGDKDLLDMIIDGDVDADDLRALKRLKPVVRTRPDLFEELDKLIQLAEGYEDEDDSVNLITGPVSLGAYLSQLGSRAAAKWARAKHLAFSLHPHFERYPPDARTSGKILAGWTLVIGICAILAQNNMYLEAAMNGDPLAIAGNIMGLAIGLGMVVRDMPTVEDALDELRKRK